jgi:hypothetical protein
MRGAACEENERCSLKINILVDKADTRQKLM